MKKIFIIISLFILCFTFVGCKNNHKNDKYEYFEVSEELKKDALNYLTNRWTQDIGDEYTVFKNYISLIKNGEPVIFVEFSENDYFYLCGYYDEKKVDVEIARQFFIGANEYTWIGFNNEKEIHEYYNGLRLMVAIQVNKPKECKYIINEIDQDIYALFMQLYEPEFDENKINIKEAIKESSQHVNLVSAEQTKFRYSDNPAEGTNITTLRRFMALDGEVYFEFEAATQNRRTGEIYDYHEKYREEFGEYYDKIMEAAIFDKYSVKSSDNRWTYYYGLVTIEDMKNIIFN